VLTDSVIESADMSQIAERRQPAWTWALRNLVLPLGDLTYRQDMMGRLRFLEAAQWWDPDRLHDHRRRSLASLIEIAYREVPFYRSLMEAAHVKPRDIVEPEDLRKLPIVTKDMLRAGYPHLTTRDTGLRTYEECSSGSTGKNFYVREDSETAGWYRASFLLALEWAGWKIGEPHLQMGMTLERRMGRWLKDAFLRCHYVSAYNLTDEYLDRTLNALEKLRIQHLWGYPGSIYCLAGRARLLGWNRPLASVVTWGDSLYPLYRETVEAAFKVKVLDTYGCAEGIQIAAQCGTRGVYHMHSLDVVVESLDDQGNPVSDGTPGNLILTRLHPGPMPLIRYQVGDVGALAASRRCECRRGFELMECIQGRDTDVVLTPSGNRLIVHFFTGVLEHFHEIDSFQVIQEDIGSILLRLVPRPDFSKNTAEAIVTRLSENGADLNIEVETVDEIPLAPSHKRRFIVSKISKPFVNTGAGAAGPPER
jgi:phenylacetate-CoA ligase